MLSFATHLAHIDAFADITAQLCTQSMTRAAGLPLSPDLPAPPASCSVPASPAVDPAKYTRLQRRQGGDALDLVFP
jgi:hypothetical protein